MPKQVQKIMSSIIRVRQDDGTFIPVFPITTTNDVYTDIDNEVKLRDYLDGMLKSREIANIDAMFQLTNSEVHENDFIRTNDEGRYFVVVDTENLNSSAGYLEILTNNSIGGPYGLAQLNENGKLALEDMEPAVEIITYSRSN